MNPVTIQTLMNSVEKMLIFGINKLANTLIRIKTIKNSDF